MENALVGIFLQIPWYRAITNIPKIGLVLLHITGSLICIDSFMGDVITSV